MLLNACQWRIGNWFNNPKGILNRLKIFWMIRMELIIFESDYYVKYSGNYEYFVTKFVLIISEQDGKLKTSNYLKNLKSIHPK